MRWGIFFNVYRATAAASQDAEPRRGLPSRFRRLLHGHDGDLLLLIDLAGGGSAAVVAPTSTDISAGTPVWGPGGASIVFCGTYQSVQDGVGYGVAFCMQRRASLFAVRAHASAHTRIRAG